MAGAQVAVGIPHPEEEKPEPWWGQQECNGTDGREDLRGLCAVAPCIRSHRRGRRQRRHLWSGRGEVWVTAGLGEAGGSAGRDFM